MYLSILTFFSGIHFGPLLRLLGLGCLIELLVSKNVIVFVLDEVTSFLEDDTVLMALPELYRFGREGKWFGMRTFIIYMIDGVYQVRLLSYLLTMLLTPG